MKLQIMTPLAVVIDEEGVRSVRAEDSSGSFGIQPGHARFLTSLSIGVIAWTGGTGARRYCAVRRGVLSVVDRQTVAIATREAVPSDDLANLDEIVLARFRADIETERSERTDTMRLQLDAIRRIVSRLGEPGRGTASGLA